MIEECTLTLHIDDQLHQVVFKLLLNRFIFVFVVLYQTIELLNKLLLHFDARFEIRVQVHIVDEQNLRVRVGNGISHRLHHFLLHEQNGISGQITDATVARP